MTKYYAGCSLPLPGGWTHTSAALDALVTDMFTPANGDREGDDNYAIVLTDGRSNIERYVHVVYTMQFIHYVLAVASEETQIEYYIYANVATVHQLSITLIQVLKTLLLMEKWIENGCF